MQPCVLVTGLEVFKPFLFKTDNLQMEESFKSNGLNYVRK